MAMKRILALLLLPVVVNATELFDDPWPDGPVIVEDLTFAECMRQFLTATDEEAPDHLICVTTYSFPDRAIGQCIGWEIRNDYPHDRIREMCDEVFHKEVYPVIGWHSA